MHEVEDVTIKVLRCYNDNDDHLVQDDATSAAAATHKRTQYYLLCNVVSTGEETAPMHNVSEVSGLGHGKKSTR